MARREAEAAVAANVNRVRTSLGVTVPALSDATGVPATTFASGGFTFGELQDVGGVLSVSPADFFRGVPSA